MISESLRKGPWGLPCLANMPMCMPPVEALRASRAQAVPLTGCRKVKDASGQRSRDLGCPYDSVGGIVTDEVSATGDSPSAPNTRCGRSRRPAGAAAPRATGGGNKDEAAHH